MELVELRQYFAVIWKWLWLIIVSTVVAGGTAYLGSRSMTPIYRASATLLVNQARQSPFPNYQDILSSERLTKTYAERLTKRPILEAVIGDLGLDMSLKQLTKKINVRPVRDTQLIELSVEDSNPGLAMEIANKIPEVFIQRDEAMQMERFAASKESLSKQLVALRSDIEATQQAISALQSPDSPADRAELAGLQNTLAQYQNSYASLLQSYEEIRLAEVQTMDTLIIDEPAAVPREPIRPRILLNTLLATVVGCMVAVGVAFLIEYLDDTVKTAEDVEQVMGLTALGIITRIFPFKEPSDALVTAAHPRSPISEAYRVLRTNLQFSSLDNPATTLLVTSAGPLEGKTTTAANLGVAMAQAGKRVILVDADLRRPVLHKIFDLPNAVGLTTMFIKDGLDIEEALSPTEVDGLRVLTSGPLPPNPSELLGSQRMESIIERLKDNADVILFDSPPVLAVADASVLATKVVGVLLVVDSGRARSDVCRKGKEALAQVGANILGVALNKVAAGSAAYYYYHYYSQGDKSERRRRRKLSGKDLLGRIPGLSKLFGSPRSYWVTAAGSAKRDG